MVKVQFKTFRIDLLSTLMAKITLKTIADEVGLSITTVSRALAGYDDVNEETRRRIVAIAERLGYQPNLAARHLRSKQTNTIGMVVPRTAHFSDPFFMELLAGVGRQASEHGYDLLVSAQMRGEEELAAYRRMVAGGRVDGMVLARVLQHDPRIDYLQQALYPFVAFGQSEDSTYPYIEVDGADGMYRLVAHLVEYGHRRFGFVLSPDELAFTALRWAGCRRALDDFGLPYDERYVTGGDLTRQSGTQAADYLLSLPEPPTAIIACNDQMALGVMQAARHRGLIVGQDVAVAGFDDIPAAGGSDPPLTTIRQPIYGIGYRLADMLVRLIHGEELEERQIFLKPELIIRASSGQPRA
jgi:LacI family transcriptional regulator